MRSVMAAVLLLVGCGGNPVGTSAGWWLRLQEARDRWDAAAIRDYAYTYQRGCFCPFTRLQVTVAGGAVVAVYDLEADTAFVAPYPDLTMGGLFAEIAEALTDHPAEFSAEYDPATGVPRSASFDPIANAVDDEWGFSVTGFTDAR